jgi:fatty acid desaturase
MANEDVNPMHARTARDTYEPAPAARSRSKHAEGSLTRVLEQQTAKIPSSVFLVSALAAMTASAAFEFAGKQRWSHFVGAWAPTLLIAGVYNKLVKTLGTA